MDPNSSFLLKIKLVGNKKKARQDLGCHTFTKVVDVDTTSFRDFVELIVDEFPPRYKEKAIVQYFDDSLQALSEVKTDQDLQLMFDKHVESNVVCMSVVYYDPSEEAPQLVTKWPPSPLEENRTQENKQNEENEENYLGNPLPENKHVGVDEETIYLDKEEENSDSEKEEDLNSCSEFEEEPLLIGKDSLPDHVNVDYDKKNPPMIVGSTYANMEEFKLALAQHAIKNEFEYQWEKSDPSRYRAYCSRK
jgi:hypothetical protein